MKAKAFEVKSILIPIDFSETSMLAIEHAAFMAKLFKADVALLHIMEKNWESFSIVAPEIVIENQSSVTDKIEKKLKEVAGGISKKYGIKVSTTIANGNIYSEISSFCSEKKVDVIVMGTHGASGFEEFFIGSNTYKVVTQSDCPVISVQTHASKVGFSNIVLPIDNSLHSRQKVGIAVEMAKRYASKIHVVGLLEEDSNASDLKKFEIKMDQINKYLKHENVIHSSQVLKGKNPAKLTLEYAQKVKADLIVIMTDQEEDITGLFIGPYAQQIVNHSKTPIMSIKPNVNPDLIESVHPY